MNPLNLTTFELLTTILYVTVVVVTLTLIYDERDPSTTLAWMLVLFALPGVGIALYFMFGRNWRRLGMRNRRRAAAFEQAHRTIRPLYEHHADGAAAVCDADRLTARISRAIQTQNGTRPLPCVNLELLLSGAEKFDRLIADIRSAEAFIHLEYFIWEQDDLTAEVCDLLAEKIAQGVEVRVLYDWVGSYPFPKDQLRELKKSGAQIRADSAQWHKINYRNHHKIAVIDGRVGYTGGMNMGREYADGGKRFATWRDTHLRFGGPLVLELQRLFCQRWYEVQSEDLFSEKYFPRRDEELDLEIQAGSHVSWAQLAVSGAESQWEAIRQAFLIAIGSAEESVLIQSPYFVPDQSVMDTLVSQSLANVDVRLMMTGIPDKRLPWWAAFSYLRALTHAGGRAYQYEAGFFHCKALTIDGRIAVLGTVNFDIRSFALHDELALFFFDEGVAQKQDAVFASDMRQCRVVTNDDLQDQGRPWRFRNALARLASRML